MYKPFYFISLILFGLIGCKGQYDIKKGLDESMGIQLVLRDSYSGSEEEQQFFIKDKKSLEEFFAGVNKTRKPGLPIPEVDFTKNSLWVYCAGIQKDKSTNLVFTKETSNSFVFKKVIDRNTKKNTAITTPFYVYKVPMESKKIVVE